MNLINRTFTIDTSWNTENTGVKFPLFSDDSYYSSQVLTFQSPQFPISDSNHPYGLLGDTDYDVHQVCPNSKCQFNVIVGAKQPETMFITPGIKIKAFNTYIISSQYWKWLTNYLPRVPESIKDKFYIRHQLDNLKDLEDGWLDGGGKAPPHKGLDWLASQLLVHYLGDLPQPLLFPTPEGGVQIEWHAVGPFEAEVDIDLSTRKGEWLCTNVETRDFTVSVFDLTDISEWQQLVSELRTLGQQTT